MSWFHFHKWIATGVEAGLDRRQHPVLPMPENDYGVKVTAIMYRCNCGANKTKIVDGHWTLAQVLGV